MLKTDQLWPGGWQFLFDDTLFQPGTDSFLLGSFPRLHRGEQVCDLGAGTGLLGLLLLAREPSLHITNVEIQYEAHLLALRSAQLNGLEDYITCLHGDLRSRELLRASSFDLIVSNPPYFPQRSGAQARSAALRTARSESACTLEELCAAAARLLRWGGRFAVVFRPQRLAELMALTCRYGLEPKRLRFVHNTIRQPPSLLLLECRRGGRTGLSVDAPFIMTDPNGSPSAELDAIYFRNRR